MLAPLFLSSAFSTGAAAITLARALSGVEVEELRRLRGIEEGAIASELALIGLGAVQLKPEIRKAAFNNKCGALFGVAVMVGQVLPLLTGRILPKKGQAGRLSQIINSLLVLSGGLMLRIAVIETGKKSVEDPAAYHAANRDSPPAGK
jgi:formate-dependent nitrite reductase membrane component NrfD